MLLLDRLTYRLAANIDGFLDLEQRANASVGANMGLLARQKLGENRVVNGSALVQLDAAEEAQETAFEDAVTLAP